MKIPSNKQWTQDNSGDTFGILGDTSNMAMDTLGKARLANKSVALYTNSDDSDFQIPVSIVYYDDSYVVVSSGGEVFQGKLPSNNFSNLVWDPTVGLYSDSVVFNNLFHVTTSTSIYTWNGGTLAGDWVDRSVSLTASINHPLAVFGTQLAVGDGNTVKLLNTSYVTQQTLTLPTQYRVVTMRTVGNYLYIGTKNLNGGNAKIYVWNGDSSAFDYEVEVGASWVFSMTQYGSSVAAITSEGQLGYVNGTSFEELAGLPVYHHPHARWQGSGGLTLNGKVFNRGMATVGNTIYINIEGDVDSGFIPEMKSGLWVYDPDIGLYHRASATSDLYVEDGGLTLSDNTLTTTNPHKLKTGDSVSFDAVSGLSGISAETKYYVTVISTTEIKLSQSRKGVQNGNYITLSGTPSAGDILTYCQNSDYYSHSASSGAIIPTTYLETPHPNLYSEVLWGARFENLSGTSMYALFSFNDSYNIGQYTTQRIYTENVKQNWKELHQFIDGLFTDSEEVAVKVQTKFEPPSKKLVGVWLDETTLNNNSTEDFTAFADIEVGYEIVIVDGYGRGRTAHVTEKNMSSSTVSLTLDESLGTTNQTSDFYYTTFTKPAQNITAENKYDELIKSNLDTTSAWVALKVELRGHELAVNTMELSNAVNKNTN